MRQRLANQQQHEEMRKTQRLSEAEKYQTMVYSPMRTQSKTKPISDFNEPKNVINDALKRHEDSIQQKNVERLQ